MNKPLAVCGGAEGFLFGDVCRWSSKKKQRLL